MPNEQAPVAEVVPLAHALYQPAQASEISPANPYLSGFLAVL